MGINSRYITNKVHTGFIKPSAYLKKFIHGSYNNLERKKKMRGLYKKPRHLIGTSSGYTQLQRGIRCEHYGYYTETYYGLDQGFILGAGGGGGRKEGRRKAAARVRLPFSFLPSFLLLLMIRV